MNIIPVPRHRTRCDGGWSPGGHAPPPPRVRRPPRVATRYRSTQARLGFSDQCGGCNRDPLYVSCHGSCHQVHGVRDFRSVLCLRSSYELDVPFLLHRIAPFPGNDIARAPAQQRDEVHPPPAPSDVRQVDPPDLVCAVMRKPCHRYGYTLCSRRRWLPLGPGQSPPMPTSGMCRCTALPLATRPSRMRSAVIRRDASIGHRVEIAPCDGGASPSPEVPQCPYAPPV